MFGSQAGDWGALALPLRVRPSESVIVDLGGGVVNGGWAGAIGLEVKP